MVIERVEILAPPGREKAFKTAMVEGVKLLAGAAGSRSVKLGHGIENPSKFLLLIEWESVDAHIAFTKTSEFESFRNLAGPFFAGPPSMEHFELSLVG
jgi:heme-degrading monooxygenase HmoA